MPDAAATALAEARVRALAQGAGPTAPQRLPRGRHKLDPGQVVASQRARLFSAMASVTATKGYATTTVADLLATAGVSRETFYELFRSKHDCFVQAFDDASVLLFSVIAQSAGDRHAAAGSGGESGDGSENEDGSRNEIRGGLGRPDRQPGRADGTSGWSPAFRRRAARFERFLGAYLDALASYPDLARLCLVEVYAAGPDMARRRAEVQERFATQVQAMFDATDDAERFACQALVAAIGGMVTTRLAIGDVEGLRALHQPLARLVRRAVGAPPP